MLSLNAFVNISQAGDQLLLLVLLPKHGRHLFLQGADDVSVDLRRSRRTRSFRFGTATTRPP